MTNAIRKVSKEVVKWVEISKLLESEDLDIETLVDTLDGETELMEALEQVGVSIMEDQMALAGQKNMIEALQSRNERTKKAIETKRNIILLAMERAELKTVKRDLFTFSVRNTPEKLVIVDEALIPPKYFKIPDPVLDKQALKQDVSGGDKINGVELSPSGVTLGMRIK